MVWYFKNMHTEKKKMAVLKFYAKWCKPCRTVMPLLEELSRNNKSIKFVKMDWDLNKMCRELYSVDSIPT